MAKHNDSALYWVLNEAQRRNIESQRKGADWEMLFTGDFG